MGRGHLTALGQMATRPSGASLDRADDHLAERRDEAGIIVEMEMSERFCEVLPDALERARGKYPMRSFDGSRKDVSSVREMGSPRHHASCRLATEDIVRLY